MGRVLMVFALLLLTQTAWSEEEKSVPKKVGESVKQAGEAAERGIEKGGKATVKGVKKAGVWVGKKLQQGGEKLEKVSK